MKLTLNVCLAVLFCLSTSNASLAQEETEPKGEVIVFLAPKCNICKFYSKQLRELHQEFSKQGFEFIGLFPNAHSDWDQIDAFRSEFKINFHLQPDEEGLADELGAGVTPEVFVKDAEGQILYSGRIDNSYVRVGKRRRNTTTSELRDALEAISDDRPVTVSETTAIGCIIERPKP